MIKRLNTCEEVAAMAVLLASDAGGGITGCSVERRRRLVVMVTAPRLSRRRTTCVWSV